MGVKNGYTLRITPGDATRSEQSIRNATGETLPQFCIFEKPLTRIFTRKQWQQNHFILVTGNDGKPKWYRLPKKKVGA